MPNYKVVDADELDAKLSAIGDSLRAKTGKTELIPIDDIPAEIDSISGGGDEDAANIIEGSAEEIRSDAETVRNYAFCYYGNLKSANFSRATNVGDSSFNYCVSLQTATFPELVTIGNSAFYNCVKLSDIIATKVKTMNTYAFNGCYSLASAEFPNALTVSAYAFYDCTSLTTANFPSLTSANNNIFRNCSSLVNVNIPNITHAQSSLFQGCSALPYVDFPKVTKIDSSVFKNCTALSTLALRNMSVCTLSNVSAFDSTPFASSGAGGIVLCPVSLIPEYMNASNWSALVEGGKCLFWPLESYTVDGTTTGEIDWDKLNADREGAFA